MLHRTQTHSIVALKRAALLAPPLVALAAVTLIGGMLMPRSARAAAVASCSTIHPGGVSVFPGDTLKIVGFASEPDNLAGTVRLTAGRSASHPFLLAEPVTSGGLSAPIRLKPTQLSTEIPMGQPRDVEVGVAGVRTAGVYDGALTVVAGQQNCRLIVQITALDRPAIGFANPEDKALSLRLTGCGPFDCSERHGNCAATASSGEQVVCLLVADRTGSSATITSARAELVGSDGKRQDIVINDAKKVVPAGGTASLPLVVNVAGLGAGHYTGALDLTVDQATAEKSLPIDLDVKDSWFWPAFTLIVSLVLLFLADHARKTFGRRSLLVRWWAARRAVRRAAPDDRAILEPQLRAILPAVFNVPEPEVDIALKRLDNTRAALATARALEQEARLRNGGTVPTAIQNALAHLRNAAQATPETVARYLTDLQAQMAALRRGSLPVPVAVAAIAAAPALPIAAPVGAGAANVGGFLNVVKIVGSAIIVAPLLRIAIVALFVFLGLKELYFDNATFGAHPFIDYGGLLAWGVGGGAVLKGLNEALQPNPLPKPQ